MGWQLQTLSHTQATQHTTLITQHTFPTHWPIILENPRELSKSHALGRDSHAKNPKPPNKDQLLVTLLQKDTVAMSLAVPGSCGPESIAPSPFATQSQFIHIKVSHSMSSHYTHTHTHTHTHDSVGPPRGLSSVSSVSVPPWIRHQPRSDGY